MREAGERVYTPNDLAEAGIIGHVKQRQERKAGRLKHYSVGRKILYGQKHVDAYLALCEKSGKAKRKGARLVKYRKRSVKNRFYGYLRLNVALEFDSTH